MASNLWKENLRLQHQVGYAQKWFSKTVQAECRRSKRCESYAILKRSFTPAPLRPCAATPNAVLNTKRSAKGYLQRDVRPRGIHQRQLLLAKNARAKHQHAGAKVIAEERS